MAPEKIVKQAKKRGLNCIAITDHETIRGGIEGKTWGDKLGVRVVVGSEVSTDRGDIIGLNLTEEIRVTGWKEVILSIHDQGGIVVLPHPYRDHIGVEEIAPLVDYIEVCNGRSSQKQNHDADGLAKRHNKPGTAGSDAHSFSEIGSVCARIVPDTFACNEILKSGKMSPAAIRRSVIVSLIKKRKFGTLFILTVQFAGKRICKVFGG